MDFGKWEFMIQGDDVKSGSFREDSTSFQDWTEIPALKYCSTDGLYSTQFELADTIGDAVYILDLGELYQVAELRLNTYQIGILTHPPYILDVSRYLNPGLNQLEVWVRPAKRNRLVGKARRGEKVYRQFKSLPLDSAGMRGPAQLYILGSDS